MSLGKESPLIFSKFNPLNTDSPVNTDTFYDPLSVRINGFWLCVLPKCLDGYFGRSLELSWNPCHPNMGRTCAILQTDYLVCFKQKSFLCKLKISKKETGFCTQAKPWRRAQSKIIASVKRTVPKWRLKTSTKEAVNFIFRPKQKRLSTSRCHRLLPKRVVPSLYCTQFDSN